MIIINLFGGPGTGKSTTAAGLFHMMKLQGYNVELVTEYAKEIVWDKRFDVLEDQLYVTAKQNRKIKRLQGQVEYVVTDSPLIMGLVYTPNEYYPNSFAHLVLDIWNSYNNYNVFLERVKEYVEIGRTQSKEQALDLDEDVKSLLDRYGIEYNRIKADNLAPQEILLSMTGTK